MSVADNTELVRRLATQAGFDRVGIGPAAPIERVPYVQQWLASGRAGSMDYLHRNQAIRADPRHLLAGARSVIVCAMNYHQRAPAAPADHRPRGRVAMYAWGEDYHQVVKNALHRVVDGLRAGVEQPFEARCCVDTVPLLERELAARAGIGWIGKNTLVLHRDLGSYFFCGEIVTTLDLTFDEPATDHCGTCTRCLEACPTGAFPAPYEMDASLCISYLTIEHRGDIAESLHRPMGDWLFGCDVCQQVCPFNRDAPLSRRFDVRMPGARPAVEEVLHWSEEDYRRVVKGSAMKRATYAMLRRNAGIVLRNGECRIDNGE